ncbi:MAG: hypothetical protein IJ894_10070, partial [Bacteroidales bacterium]|nr:hypothetical protein [Bacteroidales bacterium]
MAYTGNITEYSPSYLDVMAYIHSAPITWEEKKDIGLRLIEETSEPALKKAFDTVEELSKLKADWDGEGALPISQTVLKNIRGVLMISANEDWNNWMISPDSNATLGLQSKQSRACVSLGANEFSYYVRKNGVRMAASHV